MRSYCVYIHTTPVGKIYVGQTCQAVNNRWLKGEGYRDNPHFYSAIKKYGWDNIEHKIVAEGLTYQEADNLEKELIMQYDSINPDKGYNIQLGGHGGQVHSNVSKQKIRDAVRKSDYKFTEQHKSNISKGKKGKCSEKQLAAALKNIEARKGKPLSEEHKKRISEAKKGKAGRAWTEEARKKHSEIMKKVYSA